MQLTAPARCAALAVSLIALAGVGAQLWITSAQTGSFAAGLWAEARFFTVLTNAMVVAAFAAMALPGRALGAAWLGALTLWIAITGAVYHLMLASRNAFTGLAWWADHAQHSVVPVLVALWWLVFAPKAGLRPVHALGWLAWPLAYVVYALGRGALDGVYAYPFIDISALGYGGVAWNAVELTVGFLFGGLALVGVGRALTR